MNPHIKRFRLCVGILVATLQIVPLASQAASWQPADSPILTRWAKDVSPDNVLPEYPRPQMVRKDWQNLNGLWDYAITPKDSGEPAQWDGKILVPFPVESALSGVKQTVGEDNRLWYRRTFTLPGEWSDKRVLLHFGAVDWEAAVFVNGREIGVHRGGYDAFHFDIADALKPSGEQEIVVAVFDPTDAGTQPRGKQVRNPHSIWYTPTTGIWQTTWLEAVSEASILSMKITPDIEAETLRVEAVFLPPPGGVEFELAIIDNGEVIQSAKVTQDLSGGNYVPRKASIVAKVPDLKLWSPDSPHLYDFILTMRAGNSEVDEVSSYFGMRKVSLGKDDNGFTRILLNDEPLFQLGLLDQGFWPDGLYTAPTDEALRYDVETTKRLGFNMARKHVKIEPARWYYWCDKLGLLVWQDMPSGDEYIHGDQPDIQRSAESARQFETELKAMVDGFYNHPSIVMWVPYNEGWGQWDTPRISGLIQQWDPTRLVNSASGWTDRGVGDVLDIHRYPGPAAPKPEETRAIVLGEYGGLGLPVRGHTWQNEKNWGYRSYDDSGALTAAFVKLQRRLHPLIGSHGLSAAVYTQTSDVEIEVNGLMTYDRAIVKMEEAAVSRANQALHDLPPPPLSLKPVVPTSRESGQEWRYTTADPGADWFQPGFDDSAWQSGTGGFGTEGTPGAVVRTEWNTPDIWLRRTFDLPDSTEGLLLLMHHDEDVEVYLNGVRAAHERGWLSDYEDFAIRAPALRAIQSAGNVLAVHCHQTGGGQYIDVGLMELQRD